MIANKRTWRMEARARPTLRTVVTFRMGWTARISKPAVGTREMAFERTTAFNISRSKPVRLSVSHPLVPSALRIVREPTEATFRNFVPRPHVDYRRWLTAEGGIAILYKCHDLRFRYTLRRIVLWLTATGAAAWFLYYDSPLTRQWVNFLLFVGIAILNWYIVKWPVEIYRQIEIRPDCLILDGADVFWTALMENGVPSFVPDKKGNYILTGTYGTRHVEYLTIPRFDKNDRMAEVMAANLREAMRQLWERPS